jgi:MGT family glycosyltransferase
LTRILFGMFPAWGHVAPTVAVAQELVRRGHEVRYAMHPELAPLLTEAGLRTIDGVDWGAVAVRSQRSLRRHGAGLRWLLFAVRGRPGIGFVHDLPRGVDGLCAAIERLGAEVLVSDLAFAPGPIAAERCGIPWVGSCPYVLPPWDDDLPPWGSGLRLDAPRDRRWRRLDRRGRLFRRRMDRRIDRARRRFGLPIHPHPFSALSPWLDLVYLTERLDFPRPSLGRQVHYVGPSISARRGDHGIAFPWERLDGDRPLVLVSLGTIFVHHAAFFRRVAEAARGQPWQAVMRVDPSVERELAGSLPDNVLPVTELPQLELLERCAAMVTHAGTSSVLEALSRGLPLVLAPAAVEQPDTAARVARAGGGVRVDVRRSDAGEIRRAIERALHDAALREGARRIAADLARCDAPRVGADLIERLVETGRPVLRPEGTGATVYVSASTAARNNERSAPAGPSNERPTG